MHWRNFSTSYGLVAQGLHWLVVGLIVAQFYLGVAADDLPLGMERLQLMGRHKSLGMTIFALVLLRLLWRMVDPPPPLPAQLPRWSQRLSRLVHGAMYVLLLCLPLLGWLTSSASKLSVSWFGLFQLPDLIAHNRVLAERLGDLHSALAWVLLLLVLLHAAAVIVHPLLWRHDLIRRMLP